MEMSVLRNRILTYQNLFIGVNHLFGRAFPQLHSLIEQNHPVAVLADAAEIMADKHDGLTHTLKFFKFVITLCLEKYIPHRESLVHNQDLRININRNSKSQPHKHAAGISLNRLVNIISNIRKA